MKPQPDTTALFEEWYAAEMPRLYNYVAYLVQDRAAAEDLTAAICERALVRLAQYDAQKGSLDAWMFAIARNMVRNHQRDTSRQPRSTSLDELPEIRGRGGTPEEIAQRAEDFRQVIAHLAELSEAEQQVIALRFGADISNVDIARVLGVTPNHVGVISYRALQKLREALHLEAEDDYA